MLCPRPTPEDKCTVTRHCVKSHCREFFVNIHLLSSGDHSTWRTCVYGPGLPQDMCSNVETVNILTRYSTFIQDLQQKEGSFWVLNSWIRQQKRNFDFRRLTFSTLIIGEKQRKKYKNILYRSKGSLSTILKCSFHVSF